MAHTPTPWAMVDGTISTANWYKAIAEMRCGFYGEGHLPGPIEADDNAALIVRAVNCHQELVEALEACLVKGNKWHPCDPVVVQARAALANAKDGRHD